ncbi:MarR family transcriptional regulator [Saccharothrix coeruleofusca]|uniref:MarR family transcriptional regulator n=1 Tax=Saccharothrix coeruleofusca TaxID=33919 RepID=A0A918ARX7_9PSEU|nr:MarR family transcriptional regulator [Saccharothrix coeruleofusca]
MDHVVDAWRARRPELDTSPLEVVGRLLLCAHHLESALVAALKPLGLSFGDFDVLNTLRRIGAPSGTNPRELARSSLITSGAMTARLDRLANAGLVERAPDPTDRRGVLVRLTDSGTRLADEALTAVLAADERFLEPLGPTDRDQAARLLKRLLEPYDATA